jgi:hypothetical protein
MYNCIVFVKVVEMKAHVDTDANRNALITLLSVRSGGASIGIHNDNNINVPIRGYEITASRCSTGSAV